MVVEFRRRLTPNQGIGVLSTMSAMALAFLVMVSIPPWASTVSAVILLLTIATGVGLVFWMQPFRTRRRTPLPPIGIHLVPRGWLVGVTCAVAVAGYAALGVFGDDVIPTLFLTRHPSEAVAVRVYRPCYTRGCPHRVQFLVDGRLTDAQYAAGFRRARDERTFVYDPAQPTHVMPRSTFRRGHGTARPALGLTALALSAWCGGVAISSRRRRARALATLERQPIVASEPTQPDRLELTFGDGSRHTFLRTPELEESVRRWLPGTGDRRRGSEWR